MSTRHYKGFLNPGKRSEEAILGEIQTWTDGKALEGITIHKDHEIGQQYWSVATPVGYCTFGQLADNSWWCVANGEAIGADELEDILQEIQRLAVDALQEELDILRGTELLN